LALRLGVLTREISPEMVDAVVEQAGRRERRRRRLPAASVVYFVLGLCLFSSADSLVPPGYRSVMRWLSNGLRNLHGNPPVTSSALTKARQRLGAQPLELLFGCLRGPLGSPDTPGVFAFGLRLVCWDGTGLDLADTPANEQGFGRLQGGSPQIRLLTRACQIWRTMFAVVDRRWPDRLLPLVTSLVTSHVELRPGVTQGVRGWGTVAGAVPPLRGAGRTAERAGGGRTGRTRLSTQCRSSTCVVHMSK
jgi:hypothetical protein